MSGSAVRAGEIGLKLENCIFRDNVSITHGGAVEGVSVGLEIVHCRFLNNSATEGGAICMNSGDLMIDFCTFIENESTDGGALAMASIFYGHVTNCTFVGNTATRGSAITALFLYYSFPVSACIIADNLGGSGFYWDGQETLELNNMDIFGNEGGDWIGAIADQFGQDHNCCLDPLFCATPDDPHNFTLDFDSPCLAENNPGGVLIGAHGLGCGGPTGVHGRTPDSQQVARLECHPNPFNPETTLTFRLDQTAMVKLVLYDLAGQQITCLAEGPFGPGQHQVNWNGRDASGRGMPSGTYLAILKLGSAATTRKITLVR